jgi:hypothetical protein
MNLDLDPDLSLKDLRNQNKTIKNVNLVFANANNRTVPRGI